MKSKSRESQKSISVQQKLVFQSSVWTLGSLGLNDEEDEEPSLHSAMSPAVQRGAEASDGQSADITLDHQFHTDRGCCGQSETLHRSLTHIRVC